MFWKDLDNEDLGLKKYAYLAIKDASQDLGLALGTIGCNVANLYIRSVIQQHGTIPTSSYNDTVILLGEEWIEECSNPKIIYKEVAKEFRYIYQNLCIHWYLNNIKEFNNIDEIEQWAAEKQKYNFNNQDVRNNNTLKCNVDAEWYAKKLHDKYYEEV